MTFAPYIEGMSLTSVTHTFAKFNAVLSAKYARRYFVNADGVLLTFASEKDAHTVVLKAVSKHPARGDAFGVARVATKRGSDA